MGNLQSEEITNINIDGVEIKNIDENNPPNPQQFYANKDIFNNKKISDIISQFCKINQEKLYPNERSQTNDEIKVKKDKNNENQNMKEKTITKNDNTYQKDNIIPKVIKNSKNEIEEEKIEENGNIIIKQIKKEDSIHLDENEESEKSTSTSPIITTFNSLKHYQ